MDFFHSSPQTGPSKGRSKQALVLEEIVRLARNLGPGIKLPTAQQLADRFGVTITTLDRALVKLERSRVIFRRQGSGIYVASRLFERRVGLVFGRDLFHPKNSQFYCLLLDSCQKRALAGDHRFFFYLDTPAFNGAFAEGAAHPDIEEAVSDGKLDGMILFQKHSCAQEEWLRKLGLPVVVLSGSSPGPAVSIDPQVIDLCVKALSDAGCRSVGLLGILPANRALFWDAARRRGLQTSERWIFTPPEGSDHPHFEAHEALGEDFATDLLSRNGRDELPDGLVITDDILARGAFLRLAREGILPGKGLKIACQANKGSSALAEWKDGLILAELDPGEIAAALLSLIDRLIAGGGRQSGAEIIYVPARLAEANGLPAGSAQERERALLREDSLPAACDLAAPATAG